MELQSGQNIALTQNRLRITVSYPKAATFGSDVDASAFMLTAQKKSEEMTISSSSTSPPLQMAA